MFNGKIDFGDFGAVPGAAAEDAAAKPVRRSKKRKAPASAEEDLIDFAAELGREFEADVRKKERKELAQNRRKFKSEKMRKMADKHTRKKSSAKGVGTRTTRKETLDGMIDKMINENPDVDADKLRADIQAAHSECAVSCEKLDKIMEALIPSYEVVKQYRDVLERASNTMFGSKRTFINLSKAMRRCLHLIDTLLETETKRSRNYMSLLARTESLARSGGVSFSGLGDASASANSSAAMVLYSGAGSQLATQTTDDDDGGGMVIGERGKPVQFAVPLGNGKGMIELRATKAEQVLTGELNESFLECSMARQNHAPVLTEEGELVRRRAKVKRVSHVRSALEQRTSMKAIQQEVRRALAAGQGPRQTLPQISAPK